MLVELSSVASPSQRPSPGLDGARLALQLWGRGDEAVGAQKGKLQDKQEESN